MPLNRAKLIALRNDIQAYLNKIERQDKLGNLDTIINQHVTATVNDAVNSIEEKLGKLPGDNGAVIAELKGSLLSLGESIQKSYKDIRPVDRTDEIVSAISTIRFPEVNFPNTISVDNFPPQKIPNPVTNVKATLVADETGLLGGGGDVIHEFSENNIAAGNTLVFATYTVPAGKILNVAGVYGEGIDDGIFMLYIAGSKVWQGRNAWTQRGVQSYLEYDAAAGQVVEFKIKNNRALTRAYSGGFYGRQIDA